MTLVELLVVISIVVLLAGMMLPRMRPAIEERRIREAARSVNTYISAARNRAIETGRPCGVMFQAFATNVPGAMSLDQVEVPPPYGGDTTDARMTVSRNGFTLTARLTKGSAALLTNGVSAGDLIQFNYQGPFYSIATPGQTITVQMDYAQAMTATPYTEAVPFKILRRPLKAHAPMLQIPAGVVLDLECSGTDTKVFSAATTPIIITFAPSGGLERIYYNGTFDPAIEQIFLLVGRRERVPAAQVPAGVQPNLQDQNNLWITISPQSGMVVTGNNVGGADPRELARKAQTLGGK